MRYEVSESYSVDCVLQRVSFYRPEPDSRQEEKSWPMRHFIIRKLTSTLKNSVASLSALLVSSHFRTFIKEGLFKSYDAINSAIIPKLVHYELYVRLRFVK